MLIEKNNPVLYAVYLLYTLYNHDYSKILIREIEKNITGAINQIKDIKSFFLYKQTWWIYIFCNCPYLSKSTNSKMNNFILNIQHSVIAMGDNIANNSKKIILDYLTNTTYQKKFINWTIQKEEFYENIIYTTFERTIFNNNGESDSFENY